MAVLCTDASLDVGNSRRDELKTMRKETNMTDTTTYWTMIDSPLGPLLLTADDRGISGVIMDADIDEQIEPSVGWVEDPAHFEEARRQLG